MTLAHAINLCTAHATRIHDLELLDACAVAQRSREYYRGITAKLKERAAARAQVMRTARMLATP